MCAYDSTLMDAMRLPTSGARLPVPVERRAARLDALLPPCRRTTVALCVALCGIFLATSFYRLNDTDLWAHLDYGRWIVAHGRLPAADPLGVADGSQRFVNVPWLSQLGGYLCYLVAGPGGLQLAHAALVTLAFGLLIAAVRRRAKSLIAAIVAGVGGYVLALPTIGTVRPQLFGMVGLALVLLALAQLKTSRRPLFWLPIVLALWSNLHGSVFVGLLVLGCATAGRMWDVALWCGLKGAWREPQARRLRLLLLLGVAATLLNPVGPALWWNILLFGRNANLDDIVEWGPTTLYSLTGTLFFGSLLLTAVLLRKSRRPVRAQEVLLGVLLGLATLSAIRMLCWWALVWPYLVAPHAVAVYRAWRARRAGGLRYEATASAGADEPTAMRTLICVAVLFATLVWAPSTHAIVVAQPRSEAVVAAYDTPLFVAEEIRQRALTGGIFAPLQWADYLLWHTRDAVHPLIYSHVHLFDRATWNDYRALATASPDMAAIADRRHLSYLVVPRSTAGAMGGQLNPGGRFRILYEDQQALLLEVLPPPAAKPGTSTAQQRPSVAPAKSGA